MTQAIAARPGAIVTVACPGGSVDLAARAVTDALAAARLVHRSSTVTRTGRAGTLTMPAPGEVIVLAEAQWAADDDLASIAEPTPDDGAVVLLHRTAASTRTLALAVAASRRQDAAFVLGPSTATEVRASTGVSAAEAERRIAATAGRPDLLAAIELDGSLVADASDRLSLLDARMRIAAELIAFGLDPIRLPLVMPHAPPATGQLPTLSPGATDDPVIALEIEGLLDRPSPAGTPAAAGPDPSAAVMLDAVAHAVRTVTVGTRRAAVIDLLLRDESGVLTVDLATRLEAMTDRSPAAGEVYLRAADQLSVLDPVAALRFVDAARASGIGDRRLVLAESTAALGAGDPRRALATARDRPSDGEGSVPDDDHDRALVRAAAWVALGDLDAAASCLDATRLRPLARWARVGAGSGAPAADDRTSSSPDPGAPDELVTPDAPDAPDDASRTLAEAVETWLAGDRESCVDALRRALVRHHADPTSVHWPVSPDVVAALMHAQMGDIERAERMMIDAIAEARGGRSQRPRQLLTSAWLAATRGRLDDAANVLDGLAAPGLAPHDALWRAGVACAIAVRDAEPDALVPAASRALAAADASGTHLYDLGILTDIASAAARAGTQRIDELFAPAERAVERLGRPPAMVADLAWARLRVALCCDDAAALAAAAHHLASLSVPPHHRLHHEAAVLLERIDSGDVDAGAVERVSQALADAGRPHEAARLCGIAAVRTTSETDARKLLKVSRWYRAQRAQLKRAERVDRDVVRLSEQEVRVAQLVLEGRTHREIGATLFISAKTVEHHVAHIRTKLGAGSRAELLAAIRSYLSTI